MAYREWLQTNSTSKQNRNLRSHIEQAQKKIGEGRYLPSNPIKDDKTTGISEFVGTLLLVLLACGIAVLSDVDYVGPALLQGGLALEQVWIFILAPLIGGTLSAYFYKYVLKK